MKNIIMIKYGELTTKKANRNVFINVLVKNIKNILVDYQVEIVKNRVRMYIYTENNPYEIAQKIKKVFGIHGIVICNRVNNNIDDIKNAILSLVNNKKGQTFKIETKRALKTFAIPSMECNNIIGSYILKNTSLTVDVHHPDIKINVEIRESGTYFYDEKADEISGNGGYPVGIQGKGLLMLSGGIDSPVAGYLSLKRGV
ncbi:MAG: THUMP domain-containing protein, partial [Bacilli bacterium]|nr:THUMP domain-containing protein [Bacilli bacterium]